MEEEKRQRLWKRDEVVRRDGSIDSLYGLPRRSVRGEMMELGGAFLVDGSPSVGDR